MTVSPPHEILFCIFICINSTSMPPPPPSQDVFHVAALVDWGQHPRSQVEAVNVAGTQVVLDACRTAGVQNFIFTSTVVGSLDHQSLAVCSSTSCFSPFGMHLKDVVCRVGHPMVDVDDDHVIVPTRARDFLMGAYAETKAEAERLVLRADSDPGFPFRAVIIRPCGIYGEV